MHLTTADWSFLAGLAVLLTIYVCVRSVYSAPQDPFEEAPPPEQERPHLPSAPPTKWTPPTPKWADRYTIRGPDNG
jgi:hypothetical protein